MTTGDYKFKVLLGYSEEMVKEPGGFMRCPPVHFLRSGYPGRLLKNGLIHLLALAFAAGCENTPKVQVSQLETSGLTNSADGLVTSEYFLGLLNAVQGLQTGDPIFKRNSSAYWITPEIDKIDLELTAQEEQFESTEYQGRLKKL